LLSHCNFVIHSFPQTHRFRIVQNPINHGNFLSRTFMKSRIRSRWHRANEKPLEAQTSSQSNSAPMGEFVPSKDLPLVDDLSNAKPPASSPKNDEGKQRFDSRNRRGSGDNPKGQRNHHRGRNRDSESGEKQDSQDRKSHKRRNPRSRNGDPKGNRNRNEKNGQRSKDHSKQSVHGRSSQNNRKPKASDKQPEKKSGLGAFISKIFGS